MFRMMELHLVSRCLICLLTAFLGCFRRENKQAAAACCPRLFLVFNRYFNPSIPVLSSLVQVLTPCRSSGSSACPALCSAASETGFCGGGERK